MMIHVPLKKSVSDTDTVTVTNGQALHLQRAATSVPLNIAEGAGEHSTHEKSRFYRMAKRSATECAAIFDICRRLCLIEEARYLRGRELLLRIGAMLTKMVSKAFVTETVTETETVSSKTSL